jgi:cytochrome c-type biogenesis protein
MGRAFVGSRVSESSRADAPPGHSGIRGPGPMVRTFGSGVLATSLGVAGLVLVLVLSNAAGAAPHASWTGVLAISQSPRVTEQSNFTVSLEVANPSAVKFAYFTFCQLSTALCYAPVAMTLVGTNSFVGTTERMTSYPGMVTGVRAGYNVTIEYANDTNVTEPTVPNEFPTLNVTSSVSGEYMFEMTVAPAVYTLSGVVTDAATQAAVAGANVTLVPGTGVWTLTNASGGFAFAGLLNGSYALGITANGYPFTNVSVTIAGANVSKEVALSNATTVIVPPAVGGGGPGFFSTALGVGVAVVAIVVVLAALAAFWVTRRRDEDPVATGTGPANGPSRAREEKGPSNQSPATPSTPRRGVVARHRGAVLGAVLVVALVAAGAGLYFGHVIPGSNGNGGSAAAAPNFTLPNIYGAPFTLSSYRNTSVVLIEFTSLSCSECQIVEQSLHSLYGGYNATGTTHVQVVSVYIEPSFGDTIPNLKAYHDSHNITWTMAQDTPSLAVSRSYGVSDIPNVVIVDKQERVVYQQAGAQSTTQLQSTISSALAGTAKPVSLVTVSVFALAAVAGVSTFFSPCAFPMFPGYMSLFLGLNASQTNAGVPSQGAYKGAARRAVTAGSVTALGMIVVFLVVGIALILAASVVNGYVPYLLIVVGAILVALGALLFTNLQYWRVVAPLQALWGRLRGKETTNAPITAAAPSTKGFYVKLFGYGMGYAAAAAGCVAPVIFSAIIAGLALGLFGGILNVLIYSLTAAALMIVVTVMLAMAGQKYVNRLKAYTPVIKKVSAAVLIVVGVYLIYFYYTAWVV